MANSVLSSLSAEEIDLVKSKQLSVDELPSYFSAILKTEVQISRDFEAFLILAPSELKTTSLDWIQKAVDLHKNNKLRDDLTDITVEQELTNAELKLKEYDKQLQGFQDFRQNFQTNTEFSGVQEVQLFLTDLQRVIDELSLGRDRAFFDQTVSLVMQKFGDATNISDPQVEELQSWTSVISTYLSG